MSQIKTIRFVAFGFFCLCGSVSGKALQIPEALLVHPRIIPERMTHAQARSYCEESLSVGALAGRSYRLPTRRELVLALDESGVRASPSPKKGKALPEDLVWTSTFFDGEKDQAYAVDLEDATTVRMQINSPLRVICVAAKEGSFKKPVFQTFGDYVLEKVDRLMWAKRILPKVPFKEANAYCDALELSGYDDWRLPRMRELDFILDPSKQGPALDKVLFFNAELGEAYLWSQTPFAQSPMYFRWVADTDDAERLSLHVLAPKGLALCVRGP